MSTMCRQSARSLAFLQAEWIQVLTDCTSVSLALSQVVRGRPQRLLQLLLFIIIIIPAKAFARDYVITGVGLSVCLSVCLFVCYHDN